MFEHAAQTGTQSGIPVDRAFVRERMECDEFAHCSVCRAVHSIVHSLVGREGRSAVRRFRSGTFFAACRCRAIEHSSERGQQTNRQKGNCARRRLTSSLASLVRYRTHTRARTHCRWRKWHDDGMPMSLRPRLTDERVRCFSPLTFEKSHDAPLDAA